MNHEEAIELCKEILAMIEDEVPEHAKDEADEFFESVTEGVEAVKQTIEQTQRVSDRQAEALENWRNGVARWIH